MRKWTEQETEWFIKNYPKVGKKTCADVLRRSDGSIRTKAWELKLRSSNKFNPLSNHKRGSAFRGKKRPEHSRLMKEKGFVPAAHFTEATRKKMSSSVKAAIADGRLRTDNFKGHHHTAKAKNKMAKASKRTWSDPEHYLNSDSYKQKVSDRMSKFQQERPTLNRNSRGKSSWEEIGGQRHFFRSSWEILYARYLQFLKDKREILEWEYEPTTFWFEKIRRGVRSYKPDFRITNKNGSAEYHEVKGWMDPKSKTKIARMALYYPEIKLIVIDADAMKSIRKWERLYK